MKNWTGPTLPPSVLFAYMHLSAYFNSLFCIETLKQDGIVIYDAYNILNIFTVSTFLLNTTFHNFHKHP